MNRRQFLAGSAVAAAALPNAISIASTSPAVAALTFSGAIPLVPVSLGTSTPVLFVLDTGAAVTVVDQSLSGALGLDRFLPKSGPTLRAFVSGLNVGGQTRFVTPAIADLKPIAAALEQPVLGLLGSDFLSASRCVIDFSAKRLVLDAPNGGLADETLPMRFADIPYIRASVSLGERVLKGEFAIDTGLDSGVKLRRGAAVSTFPDLTLQPGSGVTMRGQRAQNLTKLDALRIGGLDIPDIGANFSDDAPPGGATPAFVGTIGAPAFARRQLTLDYPGGELRLSPVIL